MTPARVLLVAVSVAAGCLACRLCGAFAPRHATLTHAADCRERTAS